MLECRADGETFADAEVPRSVGAWFVVDDDWASKGSQWSGVKVEGAIEVFPGGDVRGDVGLAEYI